MLEKVEEDISSIHDDSSKNLDDRRQGSNQKVRPKSNYVNRDGKKLETRSRPKVAFKDEEETETSAQKIKRKQTGKPVRSNWKKDEI